MRFPLRRAMRALAAVVALVALVACRDAAPPAPATTAASPATTSVAAPARPAASGAPYGATPAAPEDDARGDNPGCSRRKNTGVVTSCAPSPGPVGAWSPSPREVAGVMKLAGSICYCAGPLDAQALACAREAKTGTVKLEVGANEDPTSCAITITAVSHAARRWVVVEAMNRDLATFYTVLTVYEHRASGFARYFQGYNGLPSDAEIAAGAQGVSAEMKRDWPTLPADVRAALGGPPG